MRIFNFSLKILLLSALISCANPSQSPPDIGKITGLPTFNFSGAFNGNTILKAILLAMPEAIGQFLLEQYEALNKKGGEKATAFFESMKIPSDGPNVLNQVMDLIDAFAKNNSKSALGKDVSDAVAVLTQSVENIAKDIVDFSKCGVEGIFAGFKQCGLKKELEGGFGAIQILYNDVSICTIENGVNKIQELVKEIRANQSSGGSVLEKAGKDFLDLLNDGMIFNLLLGLCLALNDVVDNCPLQVFLKCLV